MNPPLDYVAVCPSCDAARALASGDPSYRKQARRAVNEWLDAGYDIQRLTTDEARNKFRPHAAGCAAIEKKELFP